MTGPGLSMLPVGSSSPGSLTGGVTIGQALGQITSFFNARDCSYEGIAVLPRLGERPARAGPEQASIAAMAVAIGPGSLE
jgi:hypothetical protein